MRGTKFSHAGVGVGLLLLVTTMAGCTSDNGTAQTSETGAATTASPAAAQTDTQTGTQTETLGDSKWKLASAAQATLADFEITLEFADGQVAGQSAVNRYMGSFESANPGELKFGALATTMMAGPEDAMAAEQTYLAALATVTGYRLTADELILLAGSEEILTYAKSE